jgi:hypothetical protein
MTPSSPRGFALLVSLALSVASGGACQPGHAPTPKPPPLTPGAPSEPESQPPTPHDEKLFEGDGGH